MVAIDPAVIAPRKLRGLRRREYDRLVALGVFASEKIELLRGYLVDMTPIGAPHASLTMDLQERFYDLLRGRAKVRSQVPFAASDDSEPEPCISIVPIGDYGTDHPAHAFLIIEVADSSVSIDRAIKSALYAESRVDEYWIVNLPDDQVEVFRDARDGAWQQTSVHRRGDTLALTAFPDVTLAVDDILPRRR
jgi:Uma2 family endonuclease